VTECYVRQLCEQNSVDLNRHMRLSSQSSSHINVVTSCLRQIVNWSVMFIFTMVQSHTHEDTVETVLHYMSSQATTAEVTQWKCLFHMWHLSEAIICVSNLETLWHQRVKHFCWILCDNSIRCKLSFYVSWKGVLINCDLSTFNLHVYVCFSVTWVCTCIHGSAVKCCDCVSLYLILLSVLFGYIGEN